MGAVTRSALLIRHSPLPPDTSERLKWIVRIGRRAIFRVYVKYYFKQAGGSQELLDQWLPMVAAARLAEEVSGQDSLMQDLVQKGVDRYQVQDRRKSA